MAEKAGLPNWIGPVFGAIILVVGYVAYQQWHDHDQHNRQCASMKAAFMSNGNAMIGNSAVGAALSQHSKAALASPSLAASVAVGDGLMSTLDAQCPGWVTKQY